MFPENAFILEQFGSCSFLGADRKTSSHWKTTPLLFPLTVATGFYLLLPVGCISHHLVFLLLSALTLHLLVLLLSVLLIATADLPLS